jgi:arylsulfatase K
MNKPNVVFIHTDSFDGRRLSFLGHPALHNATPNLERLANEGVAFTRCYSNNPICCPSRASMLSGLFTHRCEGWNNYKGLEEDDTLFDRVLDAGYTVQRYGKEDYLSGSHTIRARVSPWTRTAGIMRTNYNMPGPVVLDDAHKRVHERDWENVDLACEWLAGADHTSTGPSGRRTKASATASNGPGTDGSPGPFFLYLGLNAPHPAFTTSRYYLDRIPEEAIDIPASNAQDHPVELYQRVVKDWRHGFDEAMVRLVRRIYFAMICEVDEMVGAVLAALERNGLLEDTIVVFSSDHGELAMEHRQWYKMSMYEGASRVPLIMRGPGLAQGLVADELVSLVDLYPTFVEMTGADGYSDRDGRSLMPRAAGGERDDRDWVLSEFHGTTALASMFMLRTGEWKYIAYPGFRPQLFRPDAEPDETLDYAEERPDMVADLDKRLREIVDYPSVAEKVRQYDKDAFREFRSERRAAGDYQNLMSRIFSGWDGIESEEIEPWTRYDQAAIDEWLAS